MVLGTSELSLQQEKKTPHTRHSGVTFGSWEALEGFWTEKEQVSVLGQLSWCWHAERAAAEAGSSVRRRLNLTRREVSSYSLPPRPPLYGMKIKMKTKVK